MRKVIETTPPLIHVPVLMEEILSAVPRADSGFYLDVTAGGGGHFFEILSRNAAWTGECWDRDPLASARIAAAGEARGVRGDRYTFRRRQFSEAPEAGLACDFILADIGISSFQVDDPSRGMSLHSLQPPDFRMDPSVGVPFRSWLKQTPEFELERILRDYGEEPKARKLAREMKAWKDDAFETAAVFADRVRRTLAYPGFSRVHPATRTFQALRIAANDELGELRRLLEWAPRALKPGGRLAVISFHSLEDRLVKTAFRALASEEDFAILTKRPVVPGEVELARNPRSRSSKLRVIERTTGQAQRERRGRYQKEGDEMV